ncbi:MAG: PD-(D/E)XK nuclease family protein [Acidobacteria bacterium]|nr:PD-(D/E)XK nuclease family protein [Acidobacteriota bacterium]
MESADQGSEAFALRIVDDTAEPEPTHSGPPGYLSPSSAGVFSQCARRWKFRYVDKLPDPPGVPALVGTFAHRVLELLMDHEDSDRTVQRARELAREVWVEIESDEDFANLALTDEGAKAFRWQSWLAIEGLWTIEDPTKVNVCATEQRIDTTIGDVPFRGIVDRLDSTQQGLVVSDYKSGRAPSPRFRADRLTQVILYAAAIEASRGVRPVRARLLYLAQKVVDVEVTDKRVDDAVNELETIWSDLNNALTDEVFEPTTGPLCAWCPYAQRCPEGLVEVTRRNALGSVRADAPALAHVS